MMDPELKELLKVILESQVNTQAQMKAVLES